MKLSNWRRVRPALVASLVSLTLSLLAAWVGTDPALSPRVGEV